MLEECEGCDWKRVIWCSIRDRLTRLPCMSEDTDATIRKLHARIKHLSGEMTRLAGLLDAYADCPSYDDARQLVYNLRKEWAKAKAEIERLRPLAEIGELVREMPDNTGLRKCTPGRYYAMKHCIGIGLQALAASESPDPTESLRHIQREKPSD